MRLLNAYDTTKERGRYGEMTSSRNPNDFPQTQAF